MQFLLDFLEEIQDNACIRFVSNTLLRTIMIDQLLFLAPGVYVDNKPVRNSQVKRIPHFRQKQ